MENTQITIHIEISSDTYAHIAGVTNIVELLKIPAEKELYKIIVKLIENNEKK